MKIREFLQTRKHQPISIGEDKTVHDGIRMLVKNRIGALPVYDSSGLMAGIVSERDILRECLNGSAEIGTTKIKQIMTTDIVIGTPDDDLDYIISMMKQKGIRHLPIVVERRLEAFISMRDVVGIQLEHSTQETHLWKDYIWPFSQ